MVTRRQNETGKWVREATTTRSGIVVCQVCGETWGVPCGGPSKKPYRHPYHYRECPNRCTRDQIGRE